MKRGLLAVPAVLALALAAWPARAHPVRIGRYAEIPFGIRPEHPYPAARGGQHREGRVRGRAPRAQPHRVFERQLRHRSPTGLAVAADGTLYVGTMGGLTAIDGATGNERWTERLGSVHSSPSLAPSDDVVVVTRAGIVALVTPEGVVRHTADLGAPSRGSPLVLDDGSVLLATVDQRIHRLDASLRRVRVTPLAETGATALALTRRGLFALASDNVVTLLDGEGRVSRQIPIVGRPSAGPAVAEDGTIWVPTADGVVHAIDPIGRVRSRTNLGSRHYDGAAPAIGHDGALRIPTLTGGIVCVGPGGSERWRFANEAGYGSPVSIDDDDTTLVIDGQGNLSALAQDGTERWRVALGGPTDRVRSPHAPVLGPDGTIYVITERAAIQAWR